MCGFSKLSWDSLWADTLLDVWRKQVSLTRSVLRAFAWRQAVWVDSFQSCLSEPVPGISCTLVLRLDLNGLASENDTAPLTKSSCLCSGLENFSLYMHGPMLTGNYYQKKIFLARGQTQGRLQNEKLNWKKLVFRLFCLFLTIKKICRPIFKLVAGFAWFP